MKQDDVIEGEEAQNDGRLFLKGKPNEGTISELQGLSK